MWNMTKEKAIAEFKQVCADMREANEKKAPMAVCVALGKKCGELMGTLERDYGVKPEDLVKMSEIGK